MSELVLYECGGERWDDGPGEAPNTCPTCGAPIDAVYADFGGDA